MIAKPRDVTPPGQAREGDVIVTPQGEYVQVEEIISANEFLEAFNLQQTRNASGGARNGSSLASVMRRGTPTHEEQKQRSAEVGRLHRLGNRGFK